MAGVWGSKFYRVVFFFPQVLAVPIIAVLFQTVYRPNETGLINGVLMKLGLEPVGFLIEPNLALLVDHRRAGLAGRRLLRGAVLGRAWPPSRRRSTRPRSSTARARCTLFFRVTLPLLWDTLQVAWVYLGIAAFDAFAIVTVLSVDSGGPDGSTTVLAVEIYRNAFSLLASSATPRRWAWRCSS